LKEFKSLQTLDLSDTKVTDKGLEKLRAARPELTVTRHFDSDIR